LLPMTLVIGREAPLRIINFFVSLGRVIFGKNSKQGSIRDMRKPVLGVKAPTAEETANNDTTRPKNPSVNTIPSKGYVLEIDGKFKSEFETSDAAMKSALDLKKKYPQIQVNVYDAKEHARTLVDLAEKSAVSIGPA
jgi:hypothetical protein